MRVGIRSIEEIVSGNSGNVDICGEKLADTWMIPAVLFPPKWTLLGDKAGPLRNKAMALYAFHGPKGGGLLAFWDGISKGTKNLIKEAEALKLRIRVEMLP